MSDDGPDGESSGMGAKGFGALAACTAALAALLCGLSVVMELSMPVVIVMIVGALLLVASAGALIGASVAAHKKPRE